MPRSPIVPVRMTEIDEKLLEKLANKYTNGNKSLLIKEALRAVDRNPPVLDSTKVSFPNVEAFNKALELEEQWRTVIENILQEMNDKITQLTEELAKVKQLQKLDLESQGITERDIKKATGERDLGELIFDE